MTTKKMGLLIQLDAGLARAQLLRAFERHDGKPTKVAEALKVSHSTVKRWIAKLKLRRDIDRIRERNGLQSSTTWGTTAKGAKKRRRKK